jgi:hypothetical protein
MKLKRKKQRARYKEKKKRLKNLLKECSNTTPNMAGNIFTKKPPDKMSKAKIKAMTSKFYERFIMGNKCTSLRNSLIKDEQGRSDFLITRLYSLKALLYGLIRLSAVIDECSFSTRGNWGVERRES